jgi:aldose 1-epimerase
MTQGAPPSGRQLEIVYGVQRATLVEVGGGLRSYDVDGVPVLDGYAAFEICSGSRGQLLAPWPNRVDGGRYAFGGEAYQLPITEPARHNAIHGLCAWVRWEVAQLSANHCVMRYRLPPQPGYPFALQVDAAYVLDAHGLAVTVTAANVGTLPAPFGVGHHPYLSLGATHIDELSLQLPAASTLASDDRMIPTGERRAVDALTDFRRLRHVGGTQLDTCFADLERDPSGVCHVRVEGSRSAATLWADAAYRYLMVYTGDTLDPAHRRRGLAVEPMTCAPNAFNSGDGLVVLEPGGAHVSHWGITY